MEQSFIAWLRGRTASLPQTTVGIGDDAAILTHPESSSQHPLSELVLCTDTIVDGVDFLSSEHALESIGRKSVLINLSDLAAMAAKPLTMLINLAVPQERSTQIAAQLYEGILEVAHQYELSLCGGDTTVYDGPISLSVTMVGTIPNGRRWLRGGAQIGDAIVVTGQFGGSILGRHLHPTPRVALAQSLANKFQINAAIDVSDGLSLDLDRMCAASGLGAELDRLRIPVHPDAHQLSSQDGQSAVDHAWGDGEDFELILAVPPDQLDALLAEDFGVPLTPIGTFTARTGLWERERIESSGDKVRYGSNLTRLSPRGFLHGRR